MLITMIINKRITELENTVKALENIMNKMEDFIVELQLASCVNALRDPDHCIVTKIEINGDSDEECMICKKPIKEGDDRNRAYFIGGRSTPMHDVCLEEWERHFDLPYL